MRLMRGMRIAAALVAGAVALTACGDDGDGNEGSGVKVGMAYDVGGRGDRSFNDSAYAGLDRAKEDLDVQIQDVSPNQTGSDRAERLKQLAENDFNPVIAVGFKYATDIKNVAGEHEDTTFAIVDDATKGDNIVNILFAEEQGSYLMGVAAAQQTKSKRVGFVGGVQSPLIKKFEAGYKAGVASVDPSITVDVSYLSVEPDFSGFTSPDKARVSANGMLDNGADVIYHAAGNSGGGVFQAVLSAREGGKKDVWAIGVDQDQYLTASEDEKKVILTSMVKRVDVGVYEFIKDFTEGKKAGGERRYDLESGGIDYAESGGYLEKYKLLDKIKAAKKDIVDGKITVPTTV